MDEAIVIHAEDLACDICLDLTVDDVFVCSSGHEICSPCYKTIGGIESCPLGYCSIFVPPPRSFRTQNMLEHHHGRLMFPCSMKILGCKFRSSYPRVKDHLMVCKFRLVNCTKPNCAKKVPKILIKFHDSEQHRCCVYKNEGCKFNGFFARVLEHQINCPFRTVKCFMGPCHVRISAQHLVNHLEEQHCVPKLEHDQEKSSASFLWFLAGDHPSNIRIATEHRAHLITTPRLRFRGQDFFVLGEEDTDQIYFWTVLIGDHNASEAFEVKYSAGVQDGPNQAVIFEQFQPVYSTNLSREQVKTSVGFMYLAKKDFRHWAQPLKKDHIHYEKGFRSLIVIRCSVFGKE